MSDVIVSVVESSTNVTVTEPTVAVDVTETSVQVSASTAGLQGASYNQGDPIYVTVRNATGATLPKGSIVYTSGANGVHTQVSLALATSDATSARVLGWLAESIANNASGLCQVEGYLDGVDTQGITEGSQLYLSGTTAGSFTATKPQAPIHLVYVGVCSKASAGNGRVYVKVQNGYELDELHDVQITSKTNNDVLQYDSATTLWKNESLLNAGIASLGSANAFTTGGHTITSEAIGVFPLSIIPFTGQTANTLRVRNSANNGDLFSVDSSGQVRSPAYLNPNSFNNSRIRPLDAGSIIDTGIFNNVALTVQNTNSTATANLTEWKNSAGSLVATLSNAGNLALYGNGITSGDHRIGTATYLSATLNVQTRSATEKGQVIRGASSQSANLTEWQTSGGGTVGTIDAFGNAGFGGTVASSSFGLRVATNANPAVIGIAVVGAASQSADLQQWRNSAGGTVAKLTASGDASFGAIALGGGTIYGSSSFLNIASTGAGQIGAIIKASSNQSTDQLQHQSSTGTVLGGRNNFGQIFTGSTSSINGSTTAITAATASSSTVAVFNYGAGFPQVAVGQKVTIAGFTTETWFNGTWVITAIGGSTGNYSFTVVGSGFTIGSATQFGTWSVPAQVSITPASFGTVGAIIRATANQNSNLTEWQNSSGTILARIESTGNLVVNSNTGAISSTTFILGSRNSGAEMTMIRQSAATTNPGANLARLYFRDGTTVGTLKLVVRAGAAGAETTILDNIPQ